MNKKNYMTPGGHKKLSDELKSLAQKERPELLKVIAWAASNGDRSENADYIYGKKRLREIDKRANFLSKRLDDAIVVDPKSIQSDNIQFGATVLVSDEEGNEKIYSIVGVDEVNTEKNHISYESPIGKSLMGKCVGDVSIVKSPKGEFELEILQIKYEDLI